MRTSENIDQLATALAAAQSEMKNAKLNKINPHFKSKYADLAEIRDTVTPALSKHGLAMLHGTEPMETTLHVVSRLIHKSGQWAESRFPVPYDKPQAMGSGITYGKRYNQSALTNIAADEDDDANAANDKPATAPLKMAVTPHEDQPRPSEFPSVTGTPGASKSAFREPYSKMELAIRNTPTLRALKDLWKDNAADIDEWPPDFVDAIKVVFGERKRDHEKALAA
jgi:hypothetical protein